MHIFNMFVIYLQMLDTSSDFTKYALSTIIWATTWQNQQNGCAPSEDSDLYAHPSIYLQSVKKLQWKL